MILIDHGADLNVQSGDKYDYKVSHIVDSFIRIKQIDQSPWIIFR